MPASREHLPAVLPATLSPDEAAATPWQVLIAGGGPAGAAAALRFARHGLRVLLVDRGSMPRWKVCGCCLSLAALDEWRRLEPVVGGERSFPPDAVPLERVRLSAAGHTATLPLPGGAVVSREVLDHALVASAIRAGCHWLPDTRIVTASDAVAGQGDRRVSVTVRHPAGNGDAETVIHSNLVVIATGLGGHVRSNAGSGRPVGRRPDPAVRPSIDRGSRIGLGVALKADAIDLPPGQLEMAISPEGYCGLIRLADGRIDLAAAIDPRSLAGRREMGDAVLRLLRTTGWDAAANAAADHLLDATGFQATPRLTHGAAVAASPSGRILRAGDAAAYVEPFTGEGIGWALASARILAESLLPTVMAGNSTPVDHAAAAARYGQAHRRHFRPLHARCRLIAMALRRPAVVAAAIRGSRLAPWVAARLVPRLIGGAGAGVQPA